MSEQLARGGKAAVIMVVSLLLYTALDLGTKEWAREALSQPRAVPTAEICEPNARGYIEYDRAQTDTLVLVDGLLDLTYAENCGAAFSMLRSAPRWVRGAVFGLAAVAACIALTMMFLRGAGGPLFAASVPLVLSGALGNLVDRVRHGYVVDFIVVHLTDTYDWPTFNVADIAIAVGVALMLIDGMQRNEPQAAAKPAEQA